MDKDQRMIYIHIPFCVQKCRYCDFLSLPGTSAELMESYCETLRKELSLRTGEGEGAVISSVFFGGGTPSILSGEQIVRILDTVREHYDLSDDTEITIEANPGTITPAKARLWKLAGVNRVSMGVQSMDDELLERLGRIHRADAVERSVQVIREAGFKRMSFDLMMGLPGQDLTRWMDTLEKAMAFEPEHLSCYSLIIEEGTPFGDLYDQGKLVLPEEEEERAMYHETVRYLASKGLQQYEISNFAKEGAFSRHNVGYWERRPYIGAGLGAASLTADQTRFNDTDDLKTYLRDPLTRCDVQQLSREEQMSEFMFLGLRKTEGISISSFTSSFGISPLEKYKEAIEKHMNDGLLLCRNDRLFLSSRGLDLANQVFMDLI